ncbi:MAG: tetratricopeptide repeat protein [Phycisphaerae bacterium]|nr:tetratricopeptide repeat protein [Phycisphaerae bacterium]
MMNERRTSRTLRLSIVLLVIAGCVSGGYVAHKYRKRAAVEASLGRGLKAYESKQYRLAAFELGRYLTVHRDDVDVLLQYADAQYQRRPRTQGSIDQAIAALEAVLRRDPAHPKAAEQLTRLYLYEVNLPIEAERVARAWMAAAPTNPAARRQLAVALAMRDQRAEALALIEDVLTEHPEDIDAPRVFVRIMFAEGYQAANQAIDAGDPAPTEPTGEPEDRHDSPGVACLHRLEELATQHPDLPGIRVALAGLLRVFVDNHNRSLSQQRALAIEHLDSAEKGQDLDLGLLVDIAQIWVNMGLFNRAAATFDRAEQLDPDRIEVYVARASVAMLLEDYTEGAAVSDRGLQTNVGERRMDLLPLAAECYARVNREEDAERCIEELRAGNAGSDVLVYLQAVNDLAQHRLERAIAGLEEAVHRNARSSRAQRAFARALLAGGQAERALAPMREYVRLERERGLKVVPGEIELAELYAQLGRWTEAIHLAQATEEHAFVFANWMYVRAAMTSIEIQARAARPGGPKPNPAMLDTLQARLAGFMSHPAAAELDRLQVLSARLHAWQGQVDQAIDTLRALRQTAPEPLELTREIVELLSQAQRYDDAIAECQAASATAGPQVRILLGQTVAELQLAQGQAEAALANLETVAGQLEGSDRAPVELRRAEILLGQQRHAEAGALLRRVADDDRQNVRARLLLLGIPSTVDPRLDRQEIIDEIKTIEGENGLYWRYAQAALWLREEDWASRATGIERLLRECIERHPSWFDPMDALVRLHERVGGWDKALATIEELISQDATDEPTRLRLQVQMIELASRAERWAEADAALADLPVSLDDAELQRAIDGCRLAQAVRRGDTARAQRLLEERISDPTDFRSRLHLADLMQSEPAGPMTGDTAARVKALIDEAERLAPDHPDVLLAQIRWLINQSRFDDAVDLCTAAVESGQHPDALLLRARAREAQGELDLAAEDFRRYTALDGRAEAGCLALGRFHLRYGRAEEAVRTWRRGLEHAPKSIELRGAMVEVLLASSEPEPRAEALKYIEQRLAEDPNDNAFLMLRADYLVRTNPAEAERIYTQVSDRSPGAAKAFARLAEMHLARNQIERAVDLVDRGLAGSPRSVPLLLMKARLLLDSRPTEATSLARQAASLQPDDEETVLTLAEALVRSGDVPGAIQALRAFLARQDKGQAFDVRVNLARLFVLAGEPDAADPLVEQADQILPGNPATAPIRILLHATRKEWPQLTELAADCLKRNPDDLAVAELAGRQLLLATDAQVREKAIGLFEHIVSRQPGSAEAHEALGMAHYQLGRIDQARTLVEEAHTMAPNDLSPLNNLTWIICEDQHDPAGAEQIAAPAIQAGVDSPHLWDTWGVVQYRLGRTEQAVQAFERALAHPQLAVNTRHSSMFHLARALAQTDPQRSLDLLDRLLPIDGGDLYLSASDRVEAEELRLTLRNAPPTVGR